MIKKVIAIDMDDTVAKLVDAWIEVVNEKEDDNVQTVTSWDIASQFKCGKKIYEYLTYDLYRNLEVFEDSQDVIKKLTHYYDVYFVTSATEFTDSLIAKVEWLKEHFPFIPMKNVVLCGDKSIIKADIMIDDGVHNLEKFDGMKVLFNANHNQGEDRFIRVYDWKFVEELLLGGIK